MRETGGGFVKQTATDWSNHDTPSMWRMLEPQETENHWRHAVGLRKLAELTSTHMRRLQRYRDHLADAWPPSNNAASQAFISRLDYLIDHVSDTHEVAVANYTTFTTAITTIEDARATVKDILGEFEAKIAARKEYVSLIESAKASQLPGTTIGPPPVTDADLEHVNDRARTVMSNLSSTLALATTQLRSPAPYTPRATIEETSGERPFGPVPQTIVHLPAPDDGGYQWRSRQTSRGSVSAGPSLSKVSSSHRAVGATELGSGAAMPSGEGHSSASIGQPIFGKSDRVWPSLVAESTARSRNQTGSAGIVRDGIVGARPADTGNFPRNRANPPGGVIGATPTPVSLPASNRTSRQESDEVLRRRAPEDHWDTPSGVPSVVLPPEPSKGVDPGPAIGLGR